MTDKQVNVVGAWRTVDQAIYYESTGGLVLPIFEYGSIFELKFKLLIEDK